MAVFDFEHGLLTKGMKRLAEEYGIFVSEPRAFNLKSDMYENDRFKSGKYYPISDTVDIYSTKHLTSSAIEHLLTKYQVDLYAGEPEDEYLEFIDEMYDKRDELLQKYTLLEDTFKERILPVGEIETVNDIEKILLMDSKYSEQVLSEYKNYVEGVVKPLGSKSEPNYFFLDIEEKVNRIIEEKGLEFTYPIEKYWERFVDIDACPIESYGKPFSIMFRLYDSGEIGDEELVEKYIKDLRDGHPLGGFASSLLESYIESFSFSDPGEFIKSLKEEQEHIFTRNRDRF